MRGKSRSLYPIYKKVDKTDCSNYSGISVLLTTYKILSSILPSSLTPHPEEIIGDHHCGFRCNRSNTDHIFCFRHIIEKKNGNTMDQCNSYLWTSRQFMIQLGGRYCIMFSLSLVHPCSWYGY